MGQGRYSQVIKGKVVDKSTQVPLPGASVLLMNSDPLNGCITDDKGLFRLDNVPLGRQSVKISYIGYKEQTIANLAITSGKEISLTIELEESVQEMGEVVIRPESDRDRPLNDMAIISARSFTVEQTERYAGSVGDPSRMAANFAGIATLSD